MTQTITTTRLDDIADRNTRSRILDVAFAAMIALMLVLGVASRRAAAAPSVKASATTSSVEAGHLAGAGEVCDAEAVC